MEKAGEKRILEKLLLAAGIILFAAVLFMSVLAAKELSTNYLALSEHKLSGKDVVTIGYDDHLYASIGAGLEIDRGSDTGVQISGFLQSNLRRIDKRILSCGILYVMMIVTVPAYWLYRRFGHDKRKHTLSVAAATAILYAVYAAVILFAHSALRMPFYSPSGYEWLLIAAGLLAVTGGSCFLAWLLRTVRFKKTLSIAAVPLVLILFLFGARSEGQLYNPAAVDSFDYLVTIDEHVLDDDYEGEVWYDEEKNAVILNGTAYEPEQVPNPDHLRGAARAGAYAYEAIDPYSGNSLFMMYEAMASEDSELAIPPLILLAYVLKAICFIVLPLLLGRKKERD